MHEIRFEAFPESTSRDRMFAVCNQIATECGEYHSGLETGIQYFNCEPCINYDAAVDFIEAHDKDFYGSYAVRYYEYPENSFTPSKKLEGLSERLAVVNTRYENLVHSNHFENLRSAYVGCKECGSKVNAKFIRHNSCPVCNSSLLPDTAKKQIADLKFKAENLREQVKAETERLQMKARKKAGINWLVKFEYHV